jgi:hypothetical protein
MPQQGKKPVIAAGDTYAAALGCLLRVDHKVSPGPRLPLAHRLQRET